MCRQILCLMGLALCLTVVPTAMAAEAEPDLQKLQGFWKVETFGLAQEDPNDPPALPAMDLRAALDIVKIEGNRVVSPWLEFVGGEIGFELDPMQSPKAIEIRMRPTGQEKRLDTTSVAYSLEKDRLSIYSLAAPEQAYLVLTRLAAASHRARLQGFWRLKSCRFQGKDVDPAELTGATRGGGTSGILIITGSWLILSPVYNDLQSDPKDIAGKFRLYPEEQPNGIRVELLDPEDPMPEWAGIYTLEDKTLTICGLNPFDPPKQEPARPRQMVVEKGDGQVLFSFQRMDSEFFRVRWRGHREAESQGQLKWIRKTHRANRSSRANELKKLIESYPNTKATEEAKRLLGPDADLGKEPREWTIDDDRKVNATFAGAAGQKVRLRTPDGQLIETTKEHLSEADRKWLENLRRAR